MVYGALVMLGFGLGTLPSVTAVAFGLSRLRQLSRQPAARVAVGLLMAAFALFSVNIPETAWNIICRH
jgi:sulfite exporter TauE/SafE